MLAQVNYTVFLVSFVGYTAAVVLVGLYASKFAKRSQEDYFLAGRSLGRWVAALSASASSESGWVTLGLVGLAFRVGVQAYWVIPGCLLGYMFNWFVLAGRMRDRAAALDAVTLPDFFALHYRERTPVLRVLTVLVILTAMLLYVAAQFAAAGKAFAAAFPQVDYQAGVLIGGVIVLAYTVSGGFRAVCWTDFLQALLMVAALVIFPIYLLAARGGYGAISGALTPDHSEMLQFTPQGSIWALLGFLFGSHALGINFGYPGQPHVLVRFMALKDRREARMAGVLAVVWGLLVYWGAVTVGLMARAMTAKGAAWGAPLLESPEASEQCLVLAAVYLLPAVMSGLVLAAILAAICSTADSQLVVAASAAANDLYARLFARNKTGEHVAVNRLVVALLGVAAVALVIREEVKVYSFVLTYGWAILGAAFGPQVILALLWRRSTWAGCLGGMLTGFVVPVVWQQTYGSGNHDVEIYNLPLAFVAALVVHVVVSLFTRPVALDPA